MKEAWLAIASAGLKGSRIPSPSPSTPSPAHVPGMNWASPCAPTGLTAFGFQPLSASSCAARSGAVTPGHVCAARRIRASYAAGTTPGRRVPWASAACVPGPPSATKSSTTIRNGNPTTAARIQRTNGERAAARAPWAASTGAAIKEHRTLDRDKERRPVRGRCKPDRARVVQGRGASSPCRCVALAAVTRPASSGPHLGPRPVPRTLARELVGKTPRGLTRRVPVPGVRAAGVWKRRDRTVRLCQCVGSPCPPSCPREQARHQSAAGKGRKA
jgi:hypothetical protein